jgi:hypothetical protein
LKVNKKRIFGIIGVVWGGAVVGSGFFRALATDNAAYAAGQLGGFILGGLMLAVGLYYAIRG